MRLAILVVYMFDSSLAPMVRVHLDYIRRNTNVPYTVYGAMLHLGLEQRSLLDGQADLILIDDLNLPAPPESSVISSVHYEHNGYLELLRERAARDGATHFVTMHQDSFPIKGDWAEHLAAKLDEGAAFASIVPYSYNACLFWGREWDADRVNLLVSDEERNSEPFRAFLSAHPELDTVDGGIGFIFRAWADSRDWFSLHPTGPNIWGGRILHIVGATRVTYASGMPMRFPPGLKKHLRLAERGVLSMLPESVKHRIKVGLRRLFVDPNKAKDRAGSLGIKREQIVELIRDPEEFVDSCLECRIETKFRADPRSGNEPAERPPDPTG